MKYNVGDLLLVKHCEYKNRPRPRQQLRGVILPYFRLYYAAELFNSYGIVTKVINHNDVWKERSTSDDDNVYIWFSQLDGKEYFFCENEVTGEVVE